MSGATEGANGDTEEPTYLKEYEVPPPNQSEYTEGLPTP
jgi:hypothetical protein